MKKFITLCAGLISAFSLLAQATSETDWTFYGTTPMPYSWVNFINYSLSSYTSGFDRDVTDAVVTVYQRVNPEDSENIQLRLDGMFNDDNSIILDVNTQDCTFTSSYTNTGFEIYQSIEDSLGEPPYQELMARFTGLSYIDSGLIYIDYGFVLCSERYGFRYNTYTSMQMNEITPISVTTDLGKDTFISRYDEPQLEVTLTAPASVATCQLYITQSLGDDDSSFSDTIMVDMSDATLDDGTGMRSKTVTVDLSEITHPSMLGCAVTPLNASGVILAPYNSCSIGIDVADNHTWKSLGIGRMSEVMGFIGTNYNDDIYDSDTFTYKDVPAVSQVEVQEAEDLPGYYRVVNPYGKNYPLYDYLIPYDSDMTFYMTIDATDPANVKVPFSFVGFISGYISYGGPGFVKGEVHNGCGILADNCITMPMYSVYSCYQHINSNCNDLELMLPDMDDPISGVDITLDSITGELPETIEYFNLNGSRVNGENLAPGIYIKKHDGVSSKIIVH